MKEVVLLPARDISPGPSGLPSQTLLAYLDPKENVFLVEAMK